MFVVCLVGLTGSGKSSIVNALAGKRVSKTGYHGTTKTIEVTGESNPLSLLHLNETFRQKTILTDDKVNICIVEIPGFEIEDDNIIDRKTMGKVIEQCDVVYWVTEQKEAFRTKREINEFNNMLDFVKQCNRDGVKIRFEIIVSKFFSVKKLDRVDEAETDKVNEADEAGEIDTDEDAINELRGYLRSPINDDNWNDNGNDNENEADTDEISEDEEEDICVRIKEYCPDVNIKKFNSYSRSARPTASNKLRDFVAKKYSSNKEFSDFIIGFDHEEFKRDKQSHMESHIEELILDKDMDVVNYMELLTDNNVITKLFTFLTSNDKFTNVCLKYFIESRKNIFENVKIDNMKYCASSACFLIGLDNYNGLRLFYSNLNLIELRLDSSRSSIIERIIRHSNNKTKIYLLSELNELDSCYDNIVVGEIPKHCTKHWIETVEKHRVNLYKNDDNIDIRSLVQHNLSNPGHVSFFVNY